MNYKRNSSIDRDSKIFQESGNYLSSRTKVREHVYTFNNHGKVSLNNKDADLILCKEDVREILLARFCSDCPYKDNDKTCTKVFIKSLKKDSDDLVVFRNQKCSALINTLLSDDFLEIGLPG
ncbi:MAG: hypothetical protein JW791_02750 [Nanoarchaeota archaeon]|nr:hypothetical protein [Nanoarchaeota archaeon]